MNIIDTSDEGEVGWGGWVTLINVQQVGPGWGRWEGIYVLTRNI